MDRKYLVISHNYYPAIGGAEKLLQSIAEHLRKEGVDVEVLTTNAKNPEMYFSKNPETVGRESEIINDVPVYREDIRNFAQKTGNIFRRIALGGGTVNTLERNARTGPPAPERKDYAGGNSAKGRRWGMDFAPLMIGPHFPKFVSTYLFSRKKYTHIICGPFPTLVPFYGYLMKLLKPQTKLLLVPCIHVNYGIHTGAILRFLARRADRILVLTREETEFFNAIGVGAEKIVEIGVGVDDFVLRQEKAARGFLFKYILHLGQEVPHKNVLLTIDAMREVWTRHRDVKLVIAGAATAYSRTISDYIAGLDSMAQQNIVRINDFDDARKVELLDDCEVMVMPSSQESFGIVYIEAWSRKKPVIGADVHAVRCLIEENVNGLLSEDRSPADLAEKIIFLLDNPEKAKEMGAAGYCKVREKYEWDTIIKKIINA
ncbi:MAG TPA: glycosyltransferase family 4 protein [Geobacteraceae bacterium]